MTDRDATDEEVRAWLAVRRAGASRDEVPVLDRIEARLDAADWDHDDCLDEPRAWPPPPPTAEAIKAERASIIAALDQSGPPATLVDDGTGWEIRWSTGDGKERGLRARYGQGADLVAAVRLAWERRP